MKIIKTFLIAAALTLFYPSLIMSTCFAQTSTQRNVNFNVVRDRRGNVIAINNLTIDNQRYNAKFVYGTFSEIFKSQNTPVWQNQQAAQRALLSINTALNARKPVITKIGVMPRNQSSFALSGNNFMIPVAVERIVRQYGKERTENVYVNGVLGGFNEKQKIWSNYSFDAFSLTPDTPFMFVKLESR